MSQSPRVSVAVGQGLRTTVMSTTSLSLSNNDQTGSWTSYSTFWRPTVSYHYTTIHNTLERAGISLKKLRRVAQEHNEDLHIDYMRKMAQYSPDELRREMHICTILIEFLLFSRRPYSRCTLDLCILQVCN
ncbi:hypothetical protein K503DRAFT_532768 [Rhizopogon vinicolor AM-OR11-026]|uniref:Uncharacterized protein n=1 Tax=Rhizopogon vinicolor AM-OR11-026 TaxID=1314800 RepID=A0A1B7ML29_9AGAM|nr:hypothetical protein K503DRAFT_532768 [Rhizopogon vinicolor AM-OR11-026]